MDEVDGGLGWAADGCLIVIVTGGRENRLPVPRALDLVLVAGVANRRESSSNIRAAVPPDDVVKMFGGCRCPARGCGSTGSLG